ncbi:amidohydrolase family protein [Egicoccus sp. AB-alg2]|uniref:amidohydrolase family protein n=1 Tax=Egicoccus sp. AB-alg2 TaxID=3242693 RepID=UPI00359DAE78
MTIIDVHTHMLTQEWVELLGSTPSRYHLAKDPTKARSPERDRIHVAGVPYSFHTPHPPYFDWELRLEKMDEAGVDIAVVSLTCPSANFGDAEVSARAARIANDDMIAAQQRWPDRIRFLATLPWQYPSEALAALDYALEHGAVGVFTCANIENDPLIHPRFAEIWAEIDRHALPVLVHPGPPPGVEVAAQLGMSNAVGFHYDTTLAIERMINTGFLDRYQQLSILGSHAGGFLPFIAGRLDYQRESPDIVPSEYLRRIYVDGMAFSDGAFDLTLEVFGPDNVLFGSDYPYGGLGGMEKFLALIDDRVPEAHKDAVRGETARKLFGI